MNKRRAAPVFQCPHCVKQFTSWQEREKHLVNDCTEVDHTLNEPRSMSAAHKAADTLKIGKAEQTLEQALREAISEEEALVEQIKDLQTLQARLTEVKELRNRIEDLTGRKGYGIDLDELAKKSA